MTCPHKHKHVLKEPEYWMGKVEHEAGVYCDDCGEKVGEVE